MAEHKLGTMNIESQEKTFDGFVNFVSKSVVFILVLLVLMAVFII
ncbi:MAG: aa3-type cytochrome c oxidase subunit IV [Rhodobacteraceae bacterium]|nr:aa3-type cytochrome c oxidase subunit IV [Paracoccaceae bacterium]